MSKDGNALDRRMSESRKFYGEFVQSMGIQPLSTENQSSDYPESSIERRIPHAALRKVIAAEPCAAAIVSSVDYRVSIEDLSDAPCMVHASGVIVVASRLMDDGDALGCAVRLGIEGRFIRQWIPVGLAPLYGLIRMFRALVASLPVASRDLIVGLTPEGEFDVVGGGDPTPRYMTWLAKIIGWPLPSFDTNGLSSGPGQLCEPLERVLESGGDTRLDLNEFGRNRYGVPPRPRPEAVHFSSSTASAISDYGFSLCDMLRRDLLAAQYRRGLDLQELRGRICRAVAGALLSELGLEENEADVAILSSGTDAELVATLVAAAVPGATRLTNILVGSEESGRGVAIAATGARFDVKTSTGHSVERGAKVQPDCMVDVVSIPIRDDEGMPRLNSVIEEDIERVIAVADKDRNRVLAHVLMSSKTGISAPGAAAIRRLVRREGVDVVVDACQVRSPLEGLGKLVRDGCMLQVSGSKFLTGPPFSGALIVPARMSERASAFADLLRDSIGVTHPLDWTNRWASRMGRLANAPHSGFGPAFRWFPALVEARLLALVPEDRRRELFERFRSEMLAAIGRSQYIRPLTVDDDCKRQPDHFLALSILSFEVHAHGTDGQLRALNEEECCRFFEYLNTDVSARLSHLGREKRDLAKLQVHLGQLVVLSARPRPLCVLRFVLGARFFTFVGHRDSEGAEAALHAEIGDAKRALAKLQLLAENWCSIC